MRTKEEILERFHSNEVEDMFDAQKTALLCLLPYEMAKPHLDPVYVEKHEKGELPEEEVWKENWSVKDQIIDYLPQIYHDLKVGDTFNIAVDFCYLRTWIWAESPSFFDIIEQAFKEGKPEDAKNIVDEIARFYEYEEPVKEESISDVDFEEITDKDIESDKKS